MNIIWASFLNLTAQWAGLHITQLTCSSLFGVKSVSRHLSKHPSWHEELPGPLSCVCVWTASKSSTMSQTGTNLDSRVIRSPSETCGHFILQTDLRSIAASRDHLSGERNICLLKGLSPGTDWFSISRLIVFYCWHQDSHLPVVYTQTTVSGI